MTVTIHSGDCCYLPTAKLGTVAICKPPSSAIRPRTFLLTSWKGYECGGGAEYCGTLQLALHVQANNCKSLAMALQSSSTQDGGTTGNEEQPTPKRRKRSELNSDELIVKIESGTGKSYVVDEEQVQFSLSIPNKLLYNWHKSREETYQQLLNGKIAGFAVKLKESSRIESLLREQASKLFKQVTKTNGRKRGYLLNRDYHLVVMKGETESFTEVT